MPTGLAEMAVDVIPGKDASSSKVQVLIYVGLVDAWSFPYDLSNSTVVYTSDISFSRRQVSPAAVTR